MTIMTGDFAIDASEATTTFCPSDRDGDPDLPEDAQLYLRHVEQGLTIRQIAREAGCHASTILRRIRRFEARRDDPLIDGAVAAIIDRRRAFDERQALRVLRRLAEPGAVMATSEVMEKAIVTRDDLRTAILDRHLAEAMALRGWVIHIPDNRRLRRYVIAPAGREALRQTVGTKGKKASAVSPDFSDAVPVEAQPNTFADQHRVFQQKVLQDPEDGRRRPLRVNIAESPLLLLARRRDDKGQAFLTPGMVAAGERLREDFELAQMGARVTQNWDGFLTAGIDKSRTGEVIRGGSDSARDRVAAALRDLGPGMGDIVLRVCCFLEGIEQTERRLGWSARSGKIVLRLALMRLERYYAEAYGNGSRLIG